MSKPKWALRHGKWGPVKPDFWRIWQENRESLKKNGYEVRKNLNGQWEVRYLSPDKRGWPPQAGAALVHGPNGSGAVKSKDDRECVQVNETR